MTYTFNQFCADIDQTYREGHFDTFETCKQFLARLIHDKVLPSLVNERLGALLAKPAAELDVQIKELTLQRAPQWTMTVSLFDMAHRYIHALPYFALYAPINRPLRGYAYRLPSNFRNELFDPSVQLEPVGPIAVEPGAILSLDSSQFVYDFQISHPVCVLRFNSAPIRPLEWLFSKTTLQAWQANDADVLYTRLRVAAAVLGKIADQSSIEPLKLLARHKHHAVRWAAIQNLGRLSRSEALVKIKEAAQDEHPHVRRAAEKTLAQLTRGRS